MAVSMPELSRLSISANFVQRVLKYVEFVPVGCGRCMWVWLSTEDKPSLIASVHKTEQY